MKRSAVLRRTIESHRWQRGIVPIVGALSLVMGTLGIGPAVAETPRSPRIVQNPATTVRTLSPRQSSEPASEEIWISSDDGPSATDQRAEPREAGTEPAPQTEVSFSVSRPSDPPEVSALAAAILRFRIPSPSPSLPDVSAKPPKAQNSQGKGLANGAKEALPATAPKQALPASAPKAVASQTPESSGKGELSQAVLALSESLKTVHPDPQPKRDGKVSTPRSPQADESLFHTTSSPVKPAALVFRPSSPSDATEVMPASSQESRPRLQMPSNPTAEPDAQAPPTGERRFRVAQVQNPLDGSRTPRNVPSRKPVAGNEKPVEREMPSVGRKQPSLEARFVSPVSRPSAPDQRESMRPEAGSADTPRTARAPQVILRVKVVDLNRASARTWGLANLGFSPRPPLLRSLTEAEPGQGPILLDLRGNDELESQLQSLKQRGVLRIRSEPTLVTVSGRPARFVTGSGSADSVAGPDVQPSVETGTLRTDVILLPLVADQGDILLEVTCSSSAPYFETDAGQNAASRNQRHQMKVRMRAGQTLAVTGLGLETLRDDQGQHPNTLARVLGLGKPKGKQPETVILVTPELVGSRPANQAATLAGHTAPASSKNRPRAKSPENSDVAKPQGNGEVAEADAPKESSPSNPFTKLWRMAKRKMPQGKSSEIR